MGKRPGQQMAEYIQSVRAKFGRYPADGCEPLEGHEYFSVRPEPAKTKLPVNREQDRKQLKYYPRSVRLDTFTRRRRKGRTE